MKNFKMLLFLSVLFFSCEKDNEIILEPEFKIEQRAKNDKVDICHWDSEADTWHLINVNANAVKAHENHGDVILVDGDGDGFFPTNNCDFEPGGDCDDNDVSIFPGASDICLDGIDQNCDGQELPCALHCDTSLDCCFCSVINEIEWTEEAFYCREEFYSGTVVQRYLCPDQECIQWVSTVIYENYPEYNYCSYSLTGEVELEYFNNFQQSQNCTNFLISTYESLELPYFCFPRDQNNAIKVNGQNKVPVPIPIKISNF